MLCKYVNYMLIRRLVCLHINALFLSDDLYKQPFWPFEIKTKNGTDGFFSLGFLVAF